MNAVEAPAEDLSATELAILRLVAAGKINAEIGEELGASLESVKARLARILAKLGARNRAQAVARAYDTGLLGTPTAATPAPVAPPVAPEPVASPAPVPPPPPSEPSPCRNCARRAGQATIEVPAVLFDEFVAVCTGLVDGRPLPALRPGARRALLGARGHLRGPRARGAA